jgi:hypothetical protein
MDRETLNFSSNFPCRLYNEIDSIITRETEMDKMTEEDRKRILESPPVGTFALMSIVIGGMVVAWLFLYYGVFLPRG